MHFEGTFNVKAPKEKVYGMMTDPNQISSCMPELQKLDVKSKDDFTAVIRTGVSFIKGDFTMHFTMVDKVPPTHAKLLSHGTGIGSTVDLEAVMDMADAEGGGTSMKWTSEAKVGGRIASVGQRLLSSQSEKIVKQLFDCLQAKLESSS
ncbi:MAG: CoxG family protein [Nitrososphaerales archaeon]